MTSYAAAGVDIEAGERAVALMKAKVARSRRPEVVDDASGFAGLFDASALLRYKRPLLATSTDGVGTKVMLAQRSGKHDTIGIDLVAMVLDDLVVCGAEPLFMTDYIACGKVVPERIAEIVGGVAEGCRLAGCALIGGETAEHPGAMGADEYDLAGAGTGVVEADGDARPGPGAGGRRGPRPGLLRRALQRLLAGPPRIKLAGLSPRRRPARAGPAARRGAAGAHQDLLPRLPGAGPRGRRARVRPHHRRRPGEQPVPLPPATLDALLDRSSWTPPAVFEVLAGHGQVAQDDMDRTFNLGVGMAAIVPAGRRWSPPWPCSGAEPSGLGARLCDPRFREGGDDRGIPFVDMRNRGFSTVRARVSPLC